MTIFELAPVSVTATGDASVVGGDTALATDDGDTTYARLDGTSGTVHIIFEPHTIPDHVPFFRWTWYAVGRSEGDLTSNRFDVVDESETFLATAPAATWLDSTYTLLRAHDSENPADWAHALTGVGNAAETGVEAGLHLDATGFTSIDPPVRLTWMRFLISYDTPEPTVTPVCRLYPRDDGRGISNSPRIHPPTKANRIVGGYQ